MKIKKNHFVIFFAIIILIIIFYYSLKNENEIPKVCFSSEKCASVEIADDNEERQKGLMFREEMDENSGMLFIFENSDYYNFWMKNTLIPLDIIWISEDMKIVDIQNAVPCLEEPCEIYKPREKAFYVLEVNSGFAERNEINIGDEVKFIK